MTVSIKRIIRQRQKFLLLGLLMALLIVVGFSIVDSISLHNQGIIPRFVNNHSSKQDDWLYFRETYDVANSNGFLFIIAAIWGWLNASWNHQSQFYTWLKSTGQPSRKIFLAIWWENSWPILLMTLIFWFSSLLIWLSATSWQTLNLGVPNLIMIFLVNLLLNQAVVSFSFLVGLFFNNQILGLMGFSLFWWLVNQAVKRIQITFQIGNPRSNVLGLLLAGSSHTRLWPLIAFYVVMIIGSAELSYLLYSHQSGENTGHLFTIPQTRWPFAVIIMALIIVANLHLHILYSWIFTTICIVMVLVPNIWWHLQRKNIYFSNLIKIKSNTN
ncbi:hypothetical protein [Lapidilactobacillus wuchangensis]|uniref:hypothetical protein n=1 Tax=Lapidilactobacillus wuchangensis TaxID=2486001 RepID=UPI000F7B9D92|nr:hypothetical protein [Lapidilactobacillus wuchangensis]